MAPIRPPWEDGPIVGDASVRASALPAGPACATTYIGSHDGLGDAWQGLVHAIDLEPLGTWIESHVGNPVETHPERLRTDLILPVQD